MRILFVGNPRSIHLARWVGQLEGAGWDIHVFDCYGPHMRPMRKGISAQIHSSTFRPHPRLNTVWRQLSRWRRSFEVMAAGDSLYFTRSRARELTRLLEELRPDIIHAMSFPHGCCPILEAGRGVRSLSDTPLIFSVWGHMFTYFARQPCYASRVASALSLFDYCAADCHRDLRLAHEAGFQGKTFGPFPGGGGYDVSMHRAMGASIAPSKRKSIAVKGYRHWYGNALLALEALGTCSSHLAGYTIEVYAAAPAVKRAARKLSERVGLAISIVPVSSHADMLRLMGKARIDLSVNTGDGTPNTMLEAMMMGAFPIQCDAESIKEWVKHGENGLLIRPQDGATVTRALRQALEDDELVNAAAIRNEQMVRERIDTSVVKPQVLSMYEQIYARGKPS